MIRLFSQPRGLFVAVAAGVLMLGGGGTALAQATPAPSPSPAPQQAPAMTPQQAAAMRAKILANADFCGGPLEINSKIGITPCVFVAGEAAVAIGDANVTANGSAQLGRFPLNLNGNIDLYPVSALYVGIGPHTQISIVPPAYASVHAQRLGVLQNGTTNMAFGIKQVLGFTPATKTVTGISFAYDAPTGSVGPRAPVYDAQFLAVQPLSPTFKVTAALDFRNANDPNTGRGTEFTPTLLAAYVSPGGTVLAGILSHNFNPNQYPVALDFRQLFGRHVMFEALYGGTQVAQDVQGPIAGIINIPIVANPRLFFTQLVFLFGQSDLPKFPKPPAGAATP